VSPVVTRGADLPVDAGHVPGRSSSELVSHIAYLARVLKTPIIGRIWAELAGQAREEGWSHEEYLAAVLARQVADREANGTQIRLAGAHFPQIKTLEEFNCDHQPSLRRDVLAHLTGCAYIGRADNVVLLGPPGVGKTHLALGLGLKAVHAGHAVLFDTAIGWITRLRDAHDEGRLAAELKRLRRYRLLIIDEVGCAPRGAEEEW
jgi:DNA replication protein DnaC